MAISITSGRILTPIKTVIYGPEGIGKSTFAAAFPRAVFIDTEGSTKHMVNVARFDNIDKWENIMEAVQYVEAHSFEFMTLVLDTADWAELMCVKKVCEDHRCKGIEDMSFGKGYVYVQETFKELLDALDRCVKRGINVVITAHAYMRKFEQPDELGSYDRWEMKLSKKVAPMIKEWADLLLFANYKTVVVTDDKTRHQKAQGTGKRTMYTTHHSCWDAKNRFNLPPEIPFEFKSIEDIIGMKASAIGPTSNETTPHYGTDKQTSDRGAEQNPTQEPEQKPEQPAEKGCAHKSESKKGTKSGKEKVAPVQQPESPESAPGSNRPISNEAGDTVSFAYAELKKLMNEAKITDAEVKEAVVSHKLRPAEEAVCDYPETFIETMLISKWRGFRSYIENNVKGNPFVEHFKEEKPNE